MFVTENARATIYAGYWQGPPCPGGGTDVGLIQAGPNFPQNGVWNSWAGMCATIGEAPWVGTFQGCCVWSFPGNCVIYGHDYPAFGPYCFSGPSLCPANSTLDGNGVTCNCTSGYQEDSTHTSCVVVTAECLPHASGTPCQCPAGFVVNADQTACVIAATACQTPRASGDPCQCPAGFVENASHDGCVAPVQHNLVITLSGLGSIEPSGTTKVNAITSLNITATVTDQGTPVAGQQVMLEASVVRSSGGHQHPPSSVPDPDPDRPKGKSIPISSGCTTVSDQSNITCPTQADGNIQFTFLAPEPSGKHKIKATCVGSTCAQQGPDEINVGVTELEQIPPSSASSYVLIIPNADINHPDNHFLTPNARDVLVNIADDFTAKKRDPNSQLSLNDASLVTGGVFDVGRDENGNLIPWKKPHAEHRRGTAIDIRANNAPGAIRPNDLVPFRTIAKRWGAVAVLECKMMQNICDISTRHFHVRLLGRAE